MTTDSFDLEAARKAAGLTQERLGAVLGEAMGGDPIPQSTISRYEQNPDDVPMGIVRKWMECCGRISAQEGLDYGDPYAEVRSMVALVEDFVRTAPEVLDDPMFGKAPTPEGFLARLKEIGRKPRVALCGRYDAGKSRLANTLMGGDRLPTAYTPATKVACVVRHVSERPKGLMEDVFLLPKGFDFDRSHDKAYLESMRVVAGSFDTLKLYGTHGDATPPGAEECHSALVFADSPFLLGCDLVDLPGYGNPGDEEKAEFAERVADVLVYASIAQGFMDAQDMDRANALLRLLPPVGDTEDDRLRNVYFVATLANMPADGVRDIIEKTPGRVLRHMGEGLASRAGREVDPETFRTRFFPFLVEDRSRREAFSRDVAELLGEVIPGVVRRRLDEAVAEMKASADTWCGGWAARLAEALENRERARQALEALERAEPERVAKVGAKRARILTSIGEAKAATRSFIDGTLSESLTPAKVEEIIRDRYEDRKEAMELAAPYLAERVRSSLDGFLMGRAGRLKSEIDDILKDYRDASVGGEAGGLGATAIPFDAQGAFIGALAGMGTAGALAAWATAVAAGSNLGSYILIAQVVSFLSSIGVSVGGTATAASAVAAIGGPVTIVIGIAALAVIAGYALFGASWQRRLAKKLCDTFREEGYLRRLAERSDAYWDETRDAFVVAIDGTEAAYKANMDSLRSLVTSTSAEEVEALIGKVEALRGFFAGIPWRPAS